MIVFLIKKNVTFHYMSRNISDLFTNPQTTFTQRLRLTRTAWLMVKESADKICWSGVEALLGSLLVVTDICSTSVHQVSNYFLLRFGEQLSLPQISGNPWSRLNVDLYSSGIWGCLSFGMCPFLWPGVAHVRIETVMSLRRTQAQAPRLFAQKIR